MTDSTERWREHLDLLWGTLATSTRPELAKRLKGVPDLTSALKALSHVLACLPCDSEDYRVVRLCIDVLVGKANVDEFEEACLRMAGVR